MSKLLFDERPLVVNPELACHIGLHEAIILQQVHYWVCINKAAAKNERDNFFWTYNSYPEWKKQFPFWSARTIQRLIRSLERKGFLISANYNKLGIDRTKWYRIDYDKLSLWKTTVSLEQDAGVSPPLPETTPKTTSETTPENSSNVFKMYEDNIGKLTPIIVDELKDLEQEYQSKNVIQAIVIATKAQKRNLNYILGILRRQDTTQREERFDINLFCSLAYKRKAKDGEPPVGYSSALRVRGAQYGEEGLSTTEALERENVLLPT